MKIGHFNDTFWVKYHYEVLYAQKSCEKKPNLTEKQGRKAADLPSEWAYARRKMAGLPIFFKPQ